MSDKYDIKKTYNFYKKVGVSLKLIELVNSNYSSFSDTEKAICKFVLESEQDLMSMNINEFAKKSLSSKSSVIRFSQKLGFTGFSEMKTFMKWEHEQRNQKDNNYSFYQQVIHDSEETINYLKSKDFTDIYHQIDDAQNIYVMSTGTTQQLQASELQRLFMMSEKDVRVIPSSTKVAEFKRMYEILTHEDLVIILSLSGENIDLEESINLLNQKNVKTISISNFQSSFLSKNCDYNVYGWSSRSPMPQDWWLRTTSTFFLLIESIVFGYNDHLHQKAVNISK